MKKNTFPIILLALILVTSCSIPHYYYSSNIQNAPLFKQKNEFTGMVAGSAGAENQFLELQAGYALPAHIALMANFYTGGKNSSTNTYTDYSKNLYFEPALGYYTSLSNILVFEVFGGYGMGSESHVFAHNDYMSGTGWQWVPDGDAQLSYSKLFVQPDIGIKKEWFEAAISARFTILNFDKVNFQNTVSHFDELNFLQKNTSSMLFEPAITFRAGGRSVKGEIQLGLSRNLTNENLRFEKVRFSAGLRVNFGKKMVEK
jgi:hypothetical protein